MFAFRLAVCALILSGTCWLRAQEIRSDTPRESPLGDPGRIESIARSEVEDDRVAATVHFLQARLAHGKGDKAAALAHYQRAWRWNPRQTSLLSQIVPLAFELKHNEEAARYAVIAAEHDPQDALLLRRLATYLTQRRDWARALKLYEQAQKLDEQAQPKQPKPDLGAVTIQLEMGRLYYLTSQFEKSAAAFAVVQGALADPQSSFSDDARKLLLNEADETYALWAEAFLSADRLDEAEALFRKSNEVKSDVAALAFHLARVASERGDSKAALAKLDEYFTAQATSAGAEPYNLLAELHAKQMLDATAARKTTIQRLEQLAKDDASNLALQRALAGQYIAADQPDKAEPLLVAVIAGQPSSDAYRKLATIYHRANQPEKLLQLAGEVSLKTGSLEALGEVGQAIAADRPLVQKLAELARREPSSAEKPSAGGERFAAGLLALAAKEFGAADDLLSVAATRQPPPKEAVLLRWGLGMMLAEQPARAAKVFQRIIDEQALAGDEASPHYYLAAALALSDRTDEALAAARRAAELRPRDPKLATRAAWILYHADRDDQARQAYLEFLARFDRRHDSFDVRDAGREARLALSNIDLKRGDYPAAIEWLQQVLDEFPEDIGAGNDLGYLWADRGEHLQRALVLIERAVQAEPDNSAYRDSLGWVYYRLGRFEDAVRELTKVAASEGADGVILEHLGDALHQSGKPAEAQSAWKRAETAFQRAGETRKLEAVRAKIKDPKNQRTEGPKDQRNSCLWFFRFLVLRSFPTVAGHSPWSNIKHRKAAVDAKRGLAGLLFQVPGKLVGLALHDFHFNA